MVNLLHFASILALGSATTVYGSPTSIDSIIPVLSNISFSDSTKDDDKICSSQSWERKIFPSPPECDVRLWVRSEDLRPSTVVEGDVRLFNNLTARSLEECNILSWSLGLRLKERGAFQYLTGRPRRPDPPPGLNLTKQINEDEDVEQDISFNSDQMVFGSIKETVRDESRELRKQWDLDLEKWVEQVREWEDEKAHYALENETTVFSSFLDMGRPESTRMDGLPNQHQISSFGVAIPSTNYRAVVVPSGASFHSSYSVETGSSYDMSYFASVQLANGSSIEIYGGSATFLPLPQTENGLSFSEDPTSRLPVSSVKHSLSRRDDSNYRDRVPPSAEKEEENWMLELELPSDGGHFVQGQNYTLKGKLLRPEVEVDSELPVSLSLHLETVAFSHWSINTITEKVKSGEMLDIDVDQDYSGNHSNSTEMLEKAIHSIKRHSAEGWKTKAGPSQLEELLSEKQKKKVSDKEARRWRSDWSPVEMVEGTSRFQDFEETIVDQLRANSSSSDSYDFQFHLSIPNSTFPTSRSGFEEIFSYLKFDLKTVKVMDLACLHLEVLKEKRVMPPASELLKCDSSPENKHSEFDHELASWVADVHKLKDSSELWKKVFDHKSQRSWASDDGTLKDNRHFKKVDVKIVPRMWQESKRTIELERELSKSQVSKKRFVPFHYSEEPDQARVPALMQGSELLKAVDLLEEEARLHERLRSSSSNSVSSSHLDSTFPTISSSSKSNITTHWVGIDKWKKGSIKKKLGPDHVIPSKKPNDDSSEDDSSYYEKKFYVRGRGQGPPHSWDYPAKRGSAAFDIGLIWNENVMLDIIKERKGGKV